MGSFDDEIRKGLPHTSVRHSLSEVLYDEPAPDRRYNASVTFTLESAMKTALQELASHKDLSFDGSVSALMRHISANDIEDLKMFLGDDESTIFSQMTRQYRRFTRARMIREFDEIVNEQVEQIQFWVPKAKWGLILNILGTFAQEIDAYPVPEWREHVAGVILRNDGMRRLRGVFDERMKDEEPKTWRKVRKIFIHWQTIEGQ